ALSARIASTASRRSMRAASAASASAPPPASFPGPPDIVHARLERAYASRLAATGADARRPAPPPDGGRRPASSRLVRGREAGDLRALGPVVRAGLRAPLGAGPRAAAHALRRAAGPLALRRVVRERAAHPGQPDRAPPRSRVRQRALRALPRALRGDA